MKILVIDDSLTMRRIIVNILSTFGYKDVVEAEHGRDGLDKLGQGEFKVIISDWNMPEMDGLEFVKEVRAKGSKIPIIMVTTNAEKNHVITALQAGVDDYVVKPFTMVVQRALKEKIETLAAKGD